tara:strand:- start:5555 stop:6043 length:489 start_codon:yes stop_codon:yes gene_type:complete
MEKEWKLLVRASHWMEAEGLRIYLESEGIACNVPERSVSGSLHGEPDLRLSGYSAVSSGFDVLVGEKDYDKAKALYQLWLERQKHENISSNEENHKDANYYLHRFLVACIGTFFVPPLMHMVALYVAYKYLKNKGRILHPKFLTGITLFVINVIVLLVYLQF